MKSREQKLAEKRVYNRAYLEKNRDKINCQKRAEYAYMKASSSYEDDMEELEAILKTPEYKKWVRGVI